MTGLASAYGFIFRGIGGASRVPGGRVLHALHMLENRLDAPEAPSRNDRRLLAGRRSLRRIGGCTWDRGTGAAPRTIGHQPDNQSPQDQKDTKRRLGHKQPPPIIY